MKQVRLLKRSILICAALLSCGSEPQSVCSKSNGQLEPNVCVDNHTLAIGRLDDKLHSCAQWGEYTYIDPSTPAIKKLYICDRWVD